MVGLGSRMSHMVGELSGGEQQRVSIAVSLANNPSLLLADEPTGEVDSNTAQVIYDTLRHLNTELRLTMILVSHDPGIARHVDRVVSIRDGMMSSETRRPMRMVQPEEVDHTGMLAEANGHHEETYEELVVLDRAGRLQIPKEFLEQFDIRGRAILDVTEDGILIRPAPQDRDAPELVIRKSSLETGPEPARSKGIRGVWQRFRRK
jgi:ABC-type glutathione transport system ATPase component